MKKMIMCAVMMASLPSFADCKLTDPVDEIMQCIIDEAMQEQGQTENLAKPDRKESQAHVVIKSEQPKISYEYP